MSVGSFTQRVVAEIAPHAPPLACCRAALVDGMRLAAGDAMETSRLVAARAVLQALHQGGVDAHVERVVAPRRPRYVVQITAGSASQAGPRSCCARSRLRGAFLSGGRVNRPDASPYLEIDCPTEAGADAIASCAGGLDIPMTVVERRGHWLALARSADAVAAFLSSIGAQGGRLEFEDGRVVREVRGGVNRRLNAETANLRRTVGAGVRQVAAIRLLMCDPARWDLAPAAVREAAQLRLQLPGETLDRLAVEAGCSRSAMAGRLRRLEEMAGAF